MINVRVTYNIYLNSITTSLNDNKKALADIEETITYAKLKLQSAKNKIILGGHTNYNDIINEDFKTINLSLESIEIKFLLFTVYKDKDKARSLALTIRTYKKALKVRDRVIKVIERYNRLFISYGLFKSLLSISNNVAIEALLNGESINFSSTGGKFYISCFNRAKDDSSVKPMRDWQASKRKKQEIIDKGGVPYKAFKDHTGKIIGDNGGEEWLINRTSQYRYKMVWRKPLFTNKNNSFNYTFIPTRANHTGMDIDIMEQQYNIDEVSSINVGIVQKIDLYNRLNPTIKHNYYTYDEL